ncbi:hypothetical protein O4U30_24755, partial [Enterobacter hormaechei subsp. xiangfangensis]|uniref:hypothetical protein n=1 Tax=Enterobacter hormaechei TaxID=158836 RepID=UPI002874115F
EHNLLSANANIGAAQRSPAITLNTYATSLFVLLCQPWHAVGDRAAVCRGLSSGAPGFRHPEQNLHNPVAAYSTKGAFSEPKNSSKSAPVGTVGR